MAVTPDYFHCITDKRFRSCVYEPEADTFLLLEALDKDAALLRSMRPRRCVEIGCGSGTVITHLQLVLSGLAGKEGAVSFVSHPSGGPWRPEYHAVDVNPVALEATQLTWSKTLRPFCGDEAPCLHLHRGDLFGPFMRETTGDVQEEGDGVFDVVLFNPPYVPTSVEELEAAGTQGDFITAAWCGGPRGRVVVDRFLSHLPRFLSASGVCYIVAIRENDVPEMVERIQEVFRGATHPGDDDHLTVTIVAERYTGEYLKVIRVLRGQQSLSQEY